MNQLQTYLTVLDLNEIVKSLFPSCRRVNGHKWATDAAVIALQKVQELEEESATSETPKYLDEEINESQSQNFSDLFEDDSVTNYSKTRNLEEETNECIPQNLSNLFEDDNVTISSKQSIDRPILHASEMRPESKISEVGDVPAEGASFDDSAAVDTLDLYNVTIHVQAERDEDKLTALQNILAETYSAIEDVKEESIKETKGANDHSGEERCVNE
jgi:hypothetical protein